MTIKDVKKENDFQEKKLNSIVYTVPEVAQLLQISLNKACHLPHS